MLRQLLVGWAVAGGSLYAVTADAQIVRGYVVEAEYGRPIPDAKLTLLDTASLVVDTGRSDANGRFQLGTPVAGLYLIYVEVDGYLSYSSPVRLPAGQTIEHRAEMPVVSVAAARVMNEVIDREAAFQLPIDDLCGEPLRPWEAGILVGVARDRGTLEAVPRAVVRLEPMPDSVGGAGRGRRDRVATGTGAYWFCNVPAGLARVIVRAEGFEPDTSHAEIRAGTMSWYDALLPRRDRRR